MRLARSRCKTRSKAYPRIRAAERCREMLSKEIALRNGIELFCALYLGDPFRFRGTPKPPVPLSMTRGDAVLIERGAATRHELSLLRAW